MFTEGLYTARQRIAPLGKEGERGPVWLESSASSGGVTVLHLLGAEGPEGYGELAGEWARAVWEAWSDHHETVRQWGDA